MADYNLAPRAVRCLNVACAQFKKVTASDQPVPPCPSCGHPLYTVIYGGDGQVLETPHGKFGPYT